MQRVSGKGVNRPRRQVFRTHMDAVSAGGECDVGSVIDVYGDPERSTDRFGKLNESGRREPLQPELNGGRTSSLRGATRVHELRRFYERRTGNR